MRRVQTQVGSQVYEWLDSAQAQNNMTALAKVCAALFGTNGMINGLAVTQTGVASMAVQIGAGEIYQMESLEATVCGTLPANTTNTILKQGIQLGTSTTSNFATPSTAGQSINYLIEAQYQDSDISLDPTTGVSPVVLQYYNASAPATPWSGPNNSGASSNTFRDGIIAYQIKAGVAATTGSQVTPSTDTGWLPVSVVTVAYGASSVTNANISAYPSAANMPSVGMLAAGFQNNYFNSAVSGGTSDALTAVFTPAVTSLGVGVPSFMVRASYANATTTPTFTPAPGVISASTIVKGNNLPLAIGDISGAGHWIELQWDVTLAKYVLINPATGVAGQTQPVGSQAQAGDIKSVSGTSAPAGWLQCPTSLSYVNATTYSALAFAIGSGWGGSAPVNAGSFTVGNTYVIQTVGTTSFTGIGAANNNVGTVFTATGVGAGTGAAYSQIALPWFPAGYAPVHGTTGIGTQSAGQVISHVHAASSGNFLTFGSGGSTVGAGSNVSNTGTTASTGGAANLAASVTVMMCVKY